MASLGSAFIVFGKVFIMSLCCLVGYLVCTNVAPYKDELHGVFAPLFIIAVVSYIMGDLFMSVYGMACDCILQCFLVDEEVNKGGGGPKHCPSTLKEFIGKYDK